MPERVLLIDYDPRSIERIRGVLAQHDILVEVQRDCRNARVDLERVRPALALIQDLLPHKHGFEVCRDLKSSSAGRDVPVLLITGIRSGREWELRETDCDGYIKKPFTDAVLLAHVRKFIPDRAPAAPVPRPARPEIPVQFSEEEVLARLDEVLGRWGAQEPEAEPKQEAKPEPKPQPEPEPEPRSVRRRGKRTVRGGAKRTRKSRQARTRKTGSKRKTTMKAAAG